MVLFAYDHNIITPRKAKYSFGIKCNVKWDEELHHNGGKKVNDEFNNSYCKNYFSKFIDKNESISSDKEIVNSYEMISSKSTIKLYKTEYENIMFVDEEDEKGNLKIFKFAELIIDVGNNFDISKRDTLVKMKIGGTFISVEAIYCKTGKSAKAYCLFD